MNSTPYRTGAPVYKAVGWTGILPTGKRVGSTPGSVPPGFTGRNGAFPDLDQLREWHRRYGRADIGLRLDHGLIGIDVDAYDGKPGGKILADLEARLGQLPPTWISTSRRPEDMVSGIRFFRCPPDAEFVTVLKDEAGVQGIEIIQFHHRWARVWPSIAPRTGRQYRWYRPDGSMAEPGVVPGLEDLGVLS
ncbi:bifunctional DNA primase/polymerase [Streptomyces canus]|uniref:bifunctional DNA primase/polymerase n=1 Tax=Streptomyces canus TaxID=58343 RepID=UPI002E286FDC|nr:bifunctional DNA primase/polymerase [Streptomyces canus]